MPALEFEAFFKEEYEPVVRALTLALGDRPSAEDSAQDGFAKAFARWNRVGLMERPAAWVYVVALRHHRRRRHRQISMDSTLTSLMRRIPSPIEWR